MKEKEFATALTVVAALYNHSISSEVMKIYYEVLKQFEIKDIKKALARHVETSKFFPKPSEIIEIINPPEDLDLKAEGAWLKLREGIREHGYYNSIEFDDPVIHSVIRSMGGWPRVSDREQDTWMKKEFIDTYKILLRKDSHPERILGVLESMGGRHTSGRIGDFLENKKAIEGKR